MDLFKDVSIRPYRDATRIPDEQEQFKLHVIDVIKGFQKALSLKWFNQKSFNIEYQENLIATANGDISEIVPNKFYAFAEPKRITSED